MSLLFVYDINRCSHDGAQISGYAREDKTISLLVDDSASRNVVNNFLYEGDIRGFASPLHHRER